MRGISASQLLSIILCPFACAAMAHIGEFAFVLLSIANQRRLLSNQVRTCMRLHCYATSYAVLSLWRSTCRCNMHGVNNAQLGH
jgi:hypothetical protein